MPNNHAAVKMYSRLILLFGLIIVAFTLTSLYVPLMGLILSFISDVPFAFFIWYKIARDYGLSNAFHMVFYPPHDYFVPILIRDELSKITYKPFQRALTVIEPDETILFAHIYNSKFSASFIFYALIVPCVMSILMIISSNQIMVICFFIGLAVFMIISRYLYQSGLVVTNRNFYTLEDTLIGIDPIIRQMSISDTTSITIILDIERGIPNRVHNVRISNKAFSDIKDCYIDTLPSLVSVLSSLNYLPKKPNTFCCHVPEVVWVGIIVVCMSIMVVCIILGETIIPLILYSTLMSLIVFLFLGWFKKMIDFNNSSQCVETGELLSSQWVETGELKSS